MAAAKIKKDKQEKKHSSVDAIIKVAVIVLFAVLVAYFVKIQTEVEGMENTLQDITQEVEQQRLKNKDLELSLRGDQEYLERTAREKLDYAHPEERVFIDASGVK